MKRIAGLLLFTASLAFATGACMNTEQASTNQSAIGSIERSDDALDALIDPAAPIAKLAEGYAWSEGPVWITEGNYLLFSDVPGNKMYRWSEADGATVFLDPSGHPGPSTEGFREPGTNGLIRGADNTILMADHGHRAVSQLDLATKQRKLLATQFQGKKFNSPNDLVLASDGTIFFTDPPYGLEGIDDSPLKELPINGVYRLDPDGTVTVVDDSLRFPNGILLSPDQRTLYVSQSDPERAIWMAYALDSEWKVTGRRVFADLTSLVGDANPGLPDGMAIDRSGNLFATGPGGVVVFDPSGKRLGTIRTGTAVANCTFGEDGKTLFLASHHMLARVRTRTTGLGF
jgi:gluconolactonase